MDPYRAERSIETRWQSLSPQQMNRLIRLWLRPRRPSPARGRGSGARHFPNLTFASQSDCLWRNQNLPGKQRHVLCAGHRSGHHVLARHRVPQRHLHRRHRAAGIPAAFPGLGLGRARARGHLDLDGRGLPRGAGKGRPEGERHRRDRHHQPARDHCRVGPRDGAGRAPRHRLAGPPHIRHLRQTEERRPRARRFRPRPA